MSKKAIVIVSVGTTHLDVLKYTTDCLVEKAKKRYPEYRVERAFSSQRILKLMQEKQPGVFCDVRTVLDRLASEGVEEVYLQPTYLINGGENEALRELIMEYKDRFVKIRKGKQLFSEKEDYIKALEVILKEAALKEDEILMLIGHGTNHHNNTEYQNLEYTAYTQGARNLYVATLEGFQKTNILMRKLQITGCKKIRLMPLLYVAGKHTKNDIAGEGDSWKTRLTEAGYEVEPALIGLGEMEGIQDLFLEHLADSIGKN